MPSLEVLSECRWTRTICLTLASRLTVELLRYAGVAFPFVKVTASLALWLLAFVNLVAVVLHGAALIAMGWAVGTMLSFLAESYVNDAVASIGAYRIARRHYDARFRCKECMTAVLPWCSLDTQLKVMLLWAIGGLAAFSTVVAAGKLIFGDSYYCFVVVAAFPGSIRVCSQILLCTLRADFYGYARDFVTFCILQAAPRVGLQVGAEASSTTTTTNTTTNREAEQSTAAAPQQPAPTSEAQEQVEGVDNLGTALVLLSNEGLGDLDDAEDYSMRVLEPAAALSPLRRRSSVYYDALEPIDLQEDGYVIVVGSD